MGGGSADPREIRLQNRARGGVKSGHLIKIPAPWVFQNTQVPCHRHIGRTGGSDLGHIAQVKLFSLGMFRQYAQTHLHKNGFSLDTPVSFCALDFGILGFVIRKFFYISIHLRSFVGISVRVAEFCAPICQF